MGPAITRQHGGPVGAGVYTVGEARPETLYLAPGSRGYVEPSVNNYNFNQTVNTRATTHNIRRDWNTAKAMTGW